MEAKLQSRGGQLHRTLRGDWDSSKPMLVGSLLASIHLQDISFTLLQTSSWGKLQGRRVLSVFKSIKPPGRSIDLSL